MSAGLTWQHQPSGYTLRKAVFVSLLVHISLILALFLSDFIPSWKPRAITIKGVGIATTIAMHPADKPKGIIRNIDVTNPSPPAPPKPKPLPTPQTKPKPEIKKTALKPLPTPKTLVNKVEKALPPVEHTLHKRVVAVKKILATPTPEPPQEEADVPDLTEKQTDKADTKIADSLDNLPQIPKNNGPVIEGKGFKDGGDLGGAPSISNDEGIALPGEYLLDTLRRIQPNFKYPGSVDTRFPKPVVTVVEFRVALDGKISEIRVRQSCGDPTVDSYAVSTIEKTASLLPLKDLIKENLGKDYITATIPFSFGGGAAGAR